MRKVHRFTSGFHQILVSGELYESHPMPYLWPARYITDGRGGGGEFRFARAADALNDLLARKVIGKAVLLLEA